MSRAANCIGIVTIVASAFGVSCQDPGPEPGQTIRRSALPAPAQLKASARRVRAATSMPSLSGTGEQARRNAVAFVDWAGGALPSEDTQARTAIHAAADNPEVAAVLGEMRSPHATSQLVRFLWQALPVDGTAVEGEIAERAALEKLQAKAVNGLAYLRSQTGDSEVLRAAAAHESVVVRAEAIASFLWNHDNSPAAREQLQKVIRPGDVRFLDRIRREPGERSQSFDAKVTEYLRQHPEAVPPAPVKVFRPRDTTPQTERIPGPPT